MKKILISIIVIFMLIAMCICVCGFELKSEKEIVPDVSPYALSESLFIAESMMVAVDGDTNKFVSFSELYDFNRNLVEYCFNFEPSGYVIEISVITLYLLCRQ